MTVAELRELSDEQLQKELREVLKESFNLRMQMGSGETVNPHHIKNARRNVARIKTLMRERQVKQND